MDINTLYLAKKHTSQEIEKVNQTINNITTGIKSIVPNGNQLIFTLSDDSQISVTLTGLSSNDFSDIYKNKLDSLDETVLSLFTYDGIQLLFNGSPIASGGTVDLSGYALKNGNVSENFSANNFTVQGNIMPTGNGTQSIGSPTNRFKEIYVNEAKLSVNTLYLGDTPVMGTNQDTIVIKGDIDQSITVKTTGVGTTKIISENGVELSTSGMNANVNVQATGSGANANLSATNQVNLNAPTVNIQGNTSVDNLTVRGNLTMQGQTFDVEATTVRVEDNIIELNKNEVGYGVTAGKSGLKINRGDADDYLLVFDETDDNFKIGIDSNLKSLAIQEYVDTQDAKKVDKVTGKSLIADTEIARLATVTNYDHTNVDNHIADSNIHVTDTDKINWNNKLDKANIKAGDNISLNIVGDDIFINSTATGGGFLNVRGLGMTIADGGNEAIISFTNPNTDGIVKVYLYASYLEDLSNQSFDYVSTHATLLSDSLSITKNAINTFNLPITDANRSKNIYVRVFVNYEGTDYSVGSSINQVLADVTPTSPCTNITTTQLSKDSVRLNWTNPVESDLKNINVVMKYDTALNSIYDGTVVYTGNSNTCTINGLEVGKHIYFRLYTLDISNNIQSDETQVIDILLDNTPPNEATLFSVLSGFSSCKLKFSDSSSSDWKMSKIVRKVGSEPTSIDDGTLVLTNTTKDSYKNNYFLDGGLSNGLSYYYKIYSIDNFGNVSSGVSQVGNPVATALPEVNNFKIENIENGTKQKISWSNSFAPSGLTYVERQLFYTKDQTVLLDTMTRDQCIASDLISSLNLGAGTGQGVNDSFTTSTTLTIGDISRYKVFIHFDSSGTTVWSSGTYDIKEVKDETPCLDYTNISFTGYDAMTRLKYADPVDTDWAKTIIILSKNGYISDENSTSSDIVQKIISTTRNEFSTNPLQFNSLTNGTQYYISLFSYDTSNNINRNVTNRATVTPNAIVVNNPTTFTAISNPQGTQINLSWTNSIGNYTSRELYGSTTDITGFTREQCQSGGYLLNNSVGTGSNNADSYTHTGVTYNTQYYYKIFTKYTYNGVDYYSSGITSNAKPLDTQAPLDLISFNATSKDTEVDLVWSFNVNDTDIQKIVIVRNSTATPTSESDGTVIVNSNVTSFNDIGLINGTTYYYRAFIYDIHGNVNSNNVGANKLNATPNEVKEYGINWNKSTDIVTRLGSAIGLNAPVVNGNTAYTNDFDNLYPWNSMKRVNLSDTGVENSIYGDVTYKTDGTNGQCMVRIPKFYYKVVNIDASNIQFWIADAPKDGYEVHPAFFRCRDRLCDDQTGITVEVDKRYHHVYLPYYNSTTGKLESKSGVSPYVNVTIGNGRNYAKARGNGWGLVDFNLRYAIQLLYLIEFASFDSQTKIGRGFVDGNTASHLTGGTNLYGNTSYGETTGKLQMSYRGIEDFYGNCYQWIDGFFCNASRNIMIGNKGFNNAGTGYTTYVTGLASNVSGYISDIFGDKTTGFVPKVCSGSETTKLYDQGYLSAGYLPVVGGYWAYASIAGMFFFLCSKSTSSVLDSMACSLAF